MIQFKSIADERLDFALDCVQEVIAQAETKLSEEEQTYTPAGRKALKKNVPAEVAKNYHQYIKSFGMLMLNSGLVAALLFAQGKANKGDNKAQAYRTIITHITHWLYKQALMTQTGEQAIVELFNKDGSAVRIITREALRFLEDLKRVADARLQKPEKN